MRTDLPSSPQLSFRHFLTSDNCTVRVNPSPVALTVRFDEPAVLDVLLSVRRLIPLPGAAIFAGLNTAVVLVGTSPTVRLTGELNLFDIEVVRVTVTLLSVARLTDAVDATTVKLGAGIIVTVTGTIRVIPPPV